MVHRITSFVVAALACLQCYGSAQPLTPAELDEAVRGLKRTEALLDHIEIAARFSVKSWDRNAQSWGPTGHDELFAVFTTPFGATGRVDRNMGSARELTSHPPGVRPRYVAGYDGRVGVFIQESPGFGEDSPASGIIQATRPTELTDWAVTASMWKATTFGFGFSERYRFSRLLERIVQFPDSLGKLTIEWLDGANDGRLIRISISRAKTKRITIDPSKGWAIIEIDQIAQGRPLFRYALSDFRELAPGLFYPFAGKRESWKPDGTPSENGTYKAHEIRVNRTDFAAASVLPEMPQRMRFQDESTGLEFSVGRRAAGLQAALLADAAKLRNATRPLSDRSIPILDEPLANSSTTDVSAPAAAGSPTRIAGLALISAAGVLVLVGFAHRRRGLSAAGSAATALLATVMLAGTAAAQGEPAGLSEFPDLRAHNCGLNACGMTLGYFGIPFDADNAARRLDIGTHWERPASLLSMKRFLSSSQCGVSSLKAKSVRAVLDNLGQDRIAIVHLEGGVFYDGHYLLFIREAEDKVLVSDPGYGHAWSPISRLEKLYEKYMSGHFLVIEEAPETAPEDPVVELSGGDVALPMLTLIQERGIQDIRVKIKNPHAFPLPFRGGRGACSCFRGARLADDKDTIAPGATETLLLGFDKSKLPLGMGERDVSLRFDDSAIPDIRIAVRMNVISAPSVDQVSCFPEAMLFLRKDGIAKKQSLKIILPAAVEIKSLTTTNEHIKIARRGVARMSTDPTVAARQVVTYEVELDDSVQPNKEMITVVITGRSERTMRIPIFVENR